MLIFTENRTSFKTFPSQTLQTKPYSSFLTGRSFGSFWNILPTLPNSTWQVGTPVPWNSLVTRAATCSSSMFQMNLKQNNRFVWTLKKFTTFPILQRKCWRPIPWPGLLKPLKENAFQDACKFENRLKFLDERLYNNCCSIIGFVNVSTE